MRAPPDRRSVLRLLAGAAPSALWLPGAARPQDAPRDQGIGGTGMMRTDPERPPGEPPPGGGDRGIGGTGVIGTIRRFGSIVVNDLRIAYPADVAVAIDGEPGKAADLKIGQVVRVVAVPEAGGPGLTTARIDVTSEVVGPVEAVAPGRMTVLGQRVVTVGLPGGWRPGARVAVSGLRRPDGVIVASLIEPRGPGPDRVAGPVRRGAGGAPTIGSLPLAGPGAPPPGRRAAVSGTLEGGGPEGGRLRVTGAAEIGLPFPPGLRRVSVEAYVGRTGTGPGARYDLGSGLPVAGRPGAAVPPLGSVRAVLTAEVGRDGVLTAERLRVEGPAPDAPRPDPGRPDAPRFERERDRLDLRGLPDDPPGAGPDGERRVFRIDPRTGPDDASGAGGFSDPNSGSGPGGPGAGRAGAPGSPFGGGPGGGGPGAGAPGGGGPGGFGGGAPGGGGRR